MNYMDKAVTVSESNPVLLDRFLNRAVEVDVDCISDGDMVVIGGLMEHIEEAGVHSGDSACSIPAYSLSQTIQEEICRQSKALAKALGVVGLMNVQFAVQNGVIYVLEVNPRASRTIPFVSKATGIPLAQLGAKVMAGENLIDLGLIQEVAPEHYFVKEAVFPFIKFPGVDAILGPEMYSTGEVMGIGQNFAEAFIKSQIASGQSFYEAGNVFLSVRDDDKPLAVAIARNFIKNGYHIVATRGTARYLQQQDIEVTMVNKVLEGHPHIVDKIKDGEIAIVINTIRNSSQSIQDSHSIRRSALTQNIPLYTSISAGLVISQGIAHKNAKKVVYALQQLHNKSK